MKRFRFIVFLTMLLTFMVVFSLPAMAATGINWRITSILSSVILTSLIVALSSILLDTIMGILISIKKGIFSLNKLPQFLAKNVLPYIGGLIVLALCANYVDELSYLFYAGVAFVTAKFGKEALYDKVKELFT